MEEQLFKIAPFEFEDIPSSELRQKWFDYKKQFTYVISALSKKKRKKLKSIFLAVAGRQLQRIYENLPQQDPVENAEPGYDFKLLIDQLDDFFAPKQHDLLERYTFGCLIPQEGETLDKFLLRCKMEANKCHFGSTPAESREIAIIDKVVKLAPPELRRKILEKSTMNMDEITKIVNSHYLVQRQFVSSTLKEILHQDHII